MSDDHYPGLQANHSGLTRQAARPKNGNGRVGQRLWRSLVLGLCGGIATLFLANLGTSWLLNRALAAAVQRGEPLRLGALVPGPLPKGQNAALVYLRAADALDLTNAEARILRGNTAETPAATILAKNQAAIALTRQAAKISACRFPVDYDVPNQASILFPHLPMMRQLADVLQAEAVWEAQNGQTDAALNDIAVLSRISEHLSQEPVLISGLTAASIENISYKTLAQVLQNTTLSPAQAQDCASRLCHTDWTAVLRHDLQGERCFGLGAFQYVSNPIDANRLQADAPSEPGLGGKSLGALWAPLWRMDEIQYLNAIDRQDAELQKPGPFEVSDNKAAHKLPWYAVCTRIMLPDLDRVEQKRDQILDYRRMALVALALNAYRTTNGVYPESLSQAEIAWGAALPHDLYTDEPFRYERKDRTVLFYSVGPNRHDDGGKKTARKNGNPGDPRPEGGGDTGPETPDEPTGPDDLVWGK